MVVLWWVTGHQNACRVSTRLASLGQASVWNPRRPTDMAKAKAKVQTQAGKTRCPSSKRDTDGDGLSRKAPGSSAWGKF